MLFLDKLFECRSIGLLFQHQVCFSAVLDLESVVALLGHEDIQMLIRTYGHNVKKETNQEAARLIDEAILKKDEEPVTASEPQEVIANDTYKLPDSLPPEARQVIERLIASYMPAQTIKRLAE